MHNFILAKISSPAPHLIGAGAETDSDLEKRLQIQFPNKNIEIINAAVTGYHVFNHTSYILAELLDYDPDLVIFFDGANDHFTNNPDYNSYSGFPYQFWR